MGSLSKSLARVHWPLPIRTRAVLVRTTAEYGTYDLRCLQLLSLLGVDMLDNVVMTHTPDFMVLSSTTGSVNAVVMRYLGIELRGHVVVCGLNGDVTPEQWRRFFS
jgi:hypothetical protein